MFISHRYKVIFVHIQRTGGHSIHEIFRQHDPDLIENIPIDPKKQRIRHCYAQDIQQAIDKETFENYYKFTVVRHPITRMWSWYQKLTSGFNNDRPYMKTKGKLAHIYQKIDFMLNSNFFMQKSGLSFLVQKLFYPFLEKNATDKRILQGMNTGKQVLIAVNKNANNFDEFIQLPEDTANGLFKRFYINQIDYISDQQGLLVDQILYFENLSEEFNQLAQKINFPGQLPHLNASKKIEKLNIHKNTKIRLQQRFAKDFSYFGYNNL